MVLGRGVRTLPARGGRAGAQCRDRRLAVSVWAGPTATAVAHFGLLGRMGWVARALVLSGDGTLMPCTPLAKASWRGRWLTRVG